MNTPNQPLPSFLDFQSSRITTPDREHARKVTGGDPGKFRRNHVMIGLETSRELDSTLAAYGHGIEYAKLLSGAYDRRRGDVPAIVQTAKRHGVVPYVGGGATEDAIRAGTLFRHARELQDAGIDTIEVSNSRGDLPAADCADEIRRLSNDFRVLVEIGTKRRGGPESRDDWHRDLDTALDANAAAVVLEGSAHGRTGIYDSRGWTRGPLVMDLAERAGDRRDRFLIEAPVADQRAFWVKEMFGWDVRLGNIPLDDRALAAVDRLRLDAMSASAQTAVAANRDIHRLFLRTLFQFCGEEGTDDDAVLFQGFSGIHADMLRNDPEWRRALRDHLRNIGMPQGMIVRVGGRMTIEELLRMMGMM